MDYFDIQIIKETLFAGFVNHVVDCLDFFKFSQNAKVKKCMADAYADKKSNRAAVVLNAPSINKQDLTKLKGMDIAFVNRGFKHPLYAELQPKYHIICDPKFHRGIWPVSWVYDIVKMVPDITICLPIDWYNKPRLQELKDNNIKICWIRTKDKSFAPFVAGFSLQYLMALGYKEIYFTGCEANGVAHEMVKDTSHFYGHNEENNLKGTKEYAYDFYTYMLNYIYFWKLSAKAKKKGITIKNLTLGGCLDMFERDSLDNINK